MKKIKKRKKGRKKNDGTDGFSVTADNRASLKPVGLAAFLRSLLREDSLGGTPVPPPL